MTQEVIDSRIGKEYSAGFVTDIESDTLPPGLDEDVIASSPPRRASPSGCSSGAWRPTATGSKMDTPEWAHVHYPPIDFRPCPTTRRRRT
jgi:Fe-S cluster assembly protein SufB